MILEAIKRDRNVQAFIEEVIELATHTVYCGRIEAEDEEEKVEDCKNTNHRDYVRNLYDFLYNEDRGNDVGHGR